MTRPRSSRLPQPRCGYRGCARFVRRGEAFCLQHRDSTGQAEAADTGCGFVDEDSGSPPYPPQAYQRLLDNDLRATLAQATSEILEQGLVDELGSLRVALLRVLLEEHDLAKLVSGIARLTTAAAQAMRVQLQIVGEDETDAIRTTSNLIREVLTKLDAEREGKSA